MLSGDGNHSGATHTTHSNTESNTCYSAPPPIIKFSTRTVRPEMSGTVQEFPEIRLPWALQQITLKSASVLPTTPRCAMTKHFCRTAIYLTIVLTTPAGAGATNVSENSLQAAVQKSLPLIESSAVKYMEHRDCFSCHHQALPILTLVEAKRRGFPVAEAKLQKLLQFTADHLKRGRKGYLEGKGQGGAADTAGYALRALSAGGWPADDSTAAVTEYLLQFNKHLDHWQTTSNRPPSEVSPFTTTFLALRGLQAFGTAPQQDRILKRVQKVRPWVMKSKPRDTEDRVSRLWSLKHLQCDATALEDAVDDLLDQQQPDGGWAQTAALTCDAYATGSALLALHQAGGLPVTDDAYQRGLNFLVQAQRADGSWYVKSRSKPFQKYFETGFPHGKDQFISIAASCWATTAMLQALPVPAQQPAGAKFPPELVKFVPYQKEPVFQAGAKGAWDEKIRERGWIMREDGLWKLYYTGYTTDKNAILHLGYATSPDGIHWTRDPKNPIYSKHWVEDMMIVKHDGKYYMFAEGYRDRAQLFVSKDGLEWTRVGQLDIRKKDGTPIPDGPYGTPTAWIENGTWYLFYEREDRGIWLATSKDTRVWANLQDEPVLTPGPAEYDRDRIALNQILKYKGRYYAYYHGSSRSGPNAGKWSTAVATSTDLIHWEKYPGNPLQPTAQNKSSGIVVHDGKQFRLYTMHPAVYLHVPAGAEKK
jgi:predicted GH43/DUF377 family glycosyl hydrolase